VKSGDGKTVLLQESNLTTDAVKETLTDVDTNPLKTVTNANGPHPKVTFMEYKLDGQGRPIGLKTGDRTYGGFDSQKDNVRELVETDYAKNHPQLSSSGPVQFLTPNMENSPVIFDSGVSVFDGKTGQSLGVKPQKNVSSASGNPLVVTEGPKMNLSTQFDPRWSLSIPLNGNGIAMPRSM